MKYLKFPYIMMFLALMETIAFTKHLVRVGAWTPFRVVLGKDIVVTILVVYLLRLSHKTEDTYVRNQAGRSIMFLLLISFFSDIVMSWKW